MSTFLRALILALCTLAAAAPPVSAQSTPANRMPALIANNQCDATGACVRQMLVYRQLEHWQQSMLVGLLNAMPMAAAASAPSASCTWHQTILICSLITSEGTCACVLTQAGGGCIGTHPGCPARL